MKRFRDKRKSEGMCFKGVNQHDELGKQLRTEWAALGWEAQKQYFEPMKNPLEKYLAPKASSQESQVEAAGTVSPTSLAEAEVETEPGPEPLQSPAQASGAAAQGLEAEAAYWAATAGAALAAVDAAKVPVSLRGPLGIATHNVDMPVATVPDGAPQTSEHGDRAGGVSGPRPRSREKSHDEECRRQLTQQRSERRPARNGSGSHRDSSATSSAGGRSRSRSAHASRGRGRRGSSSRHARSRSSSSRAWSLVREAERRRKERSSTRSRSRVRPASTKKVRSPSGGELVKESGGEAKPSALEQETK